MFWRRKWQPTPVFLPGEFHGQRSLAGYSPWGHKESDTTEHLTHTYVVFTSFMCCFLIDLFMVMQCPLSLVTVFVLKHIFNFLISTCMENLFSFLHFQFECVFRSELSLCAVLSHSVVSYSLQHHEL